MDAGREGGCGIGEVSDEFGSGTGVPIGRGGGRRDTAGMDNEETSAFRGGGWDGWGDAEEITDEDEPPGRVESAIGTVGTNVSCQRTKIREGMTDVCNSKGAFLPSLLGFQCWS